MTHRFLSQTGVFLCLLLAVAARLPAQCPTLSPTATSTSPNCAPAVTPCTLCPGSQLTLTASGTNLPAGACVNWYYGTTNNFNPYNGAGSLFGCSPITPPAVNSCNPNPLTLGIFVDACGTEENNEFISVWSGGGFFVDDMSLDFDASNNGGAGNDDIGFGCGWQTPSGFAISSIQNNCPNATVIGAGPGSSVPPGVPVIIFTSAGLDFDYNFSALCVAFGTIYVLQNGCARSTGAFTNGGGGGSQSTTLSLACGWSQTTNYNTVALLPAADGDFVTDAGFPSFAGNAGCGYPPLPAGPGGGPGPNNTAAPFTGTITQDMCNGGPYWMVGVIQPPTPGCPPTFTNYMPFNVPCPNPVLGTATICQNNGPFNLNPLRDPAVPNGTWSGPGVSGSNFNPAGQLGAVTLTFTPSGPCGTPATTTVTVVAPPAVSILPVAPVCAGATVTLTLNFLGVPPWDFTLTANGVPVNSFTAVSTPFTIPVTVNGPTTFAVTAFTDSQCNGPNASTFVQTSTPPSATLTLTGPGQVCAGQPTTFSVDFTGGSAPYSFTYAINGVNQPPVTTSNDPYTLTVPITANANVSLVASSSNGCIGTASGTAAVTTMPSPTAMLPTDTLNLCAGQSGWVGVAFTGAGPYTFVYAINNVAQPAVTTPDNPYILALSAGTGTQVYSLNSVTAGGCPGAVSGAYTVVTGTPPVATLTGSQAACPGDTVALGIAFSGSGPYVVTYEANGLFAGTDTTTANPYTLTVAPAVSTTYNLTTFSAGGCAGSVAGQATVTVDTTTVTAVLSGSAQICQNGSGTGLQVAFTGSGPYTFAYMANNVLQPPVTTTQNPYIFNVNPNIGTVYVPVSVSNGNCPGTVSGQAVVFVFTPPTALLTGTQTVCPGDSATVTVDFTGTGPFTIVLARDGVQLPAIETFEDPFFYTFLPTATTTIVLDSVGSPGCDGQPLGQAVVTVNSIPTFSNVQEQCNPVQGSYVVTFDVGNATPPLTLTSGAGSFSGTTFTSAPIPQTQPFSFVFHDSNACADVTVSGVTMCGCAANAGTMQLAADTACVTDTIAAVHNGDAVLGPGDLLQFLLHTDPGPNAGTALGWSATPAFGFDPATMQAGTTYYLSAVAGPVDGTGNVDLNDPCTSVAAGTPIVFLSPPTATLTALDTVVCPGSPVGLSLNFSGAAPFSVTAAVNGTPQSAITGVNGPVYFVVQLFGQSSTIDLVAVSDAYCPSGTTSGQVQVAMATPVSIQNVQSACDLSNQTYALTFDAAGNGSYTVSGLSGSFSGNQFTSAPVPFGQPYFAVLTDALNCSADTIAGDVQCSCFTDAGAMDTGLQTACENDTIGVAPSAGAGLDNDDLLLYALHTGAGPALGAVFAWSFNPQFSLQPGMQTGTTYYISAVAGNAGPGASIDTTDFCLSVAAGTPVRWEAIPTATLDGAYDICPGASQSLVISLAGSPPFSLTYTNNGVPTTTPVLSTSFTIVTTLLQTTTFELISVQTAACPGTATGQATVTVHQPPVIANPTIDCAPDNSSYTVRFGVPAQSGNSVAISGMNGGVFDPGTGQFVSAPIPYPQPYSFLASDTLWQCGADNLDGVPACACVTDAGALDTTPIVLCVGEDVGFAAATGTFLDFNDTLVYALVTTDDPATWSIVATSATPNFAYPAGAVVPGIPYFVVALAGDAGVSPTDTCRAVAIGPAVTWRAPVTATLSGSTSICPGDSAVLTVSFTGSGPYDLTYSMGGQNFSATTSANPYPIVVTPVNTVAFGLVSVDGPGGCPGTATGQATVTVLTPPTASLSGDTTVCAGENVTLEIGFTGTAPFTFTYSRNGVVLPALTALVPAFTLVVTNVQADQTFAVLSVSDAGCAGVAAGSATIAVEMPASVSLAGPAGICAGEPAVLTLQLQGAAAADVTIDTGGVAVQLPGAVQGTTITVYPGSTTTYGITAASVGGTVCATDIAAPWTVAVSDLQATATVSDYGGFNVRCAGGTDGGIAVQPSGGTAPLTAVWSNGASGLTLEDLAEGAYGLVLTDAAGCTYADSFFLSAPPPVGIDAMGIGPTCFGDADGAVVFQAITGGQMPYTLVLDGLSVDLPDTLPVVFTNLASGDHVLEVEDANGCATFDTISVPAPVELLVGLGADTTLVYGDSLLLEALTSYPVDSFQWTPSGSLHGPGQTLQWIRPLTSTRFTVTVRDSNGCTATDDRLIMVEKRRRVYIPNVVAPGAVNDANGGFTVFVGAEVSAVPLLRIYDRWGELVYERRNLAPNDAGSAWHGDWKGQAVPPGVYVYLIEIDFFDGTSEVFSGDVTVVR